MTWTAPTRPKKAPRDPRLVALSDKFLQCRVDRHFLPELPDYYQRWRFPDNDVLETRRTCERCGAVETRMVSELDGGLYRPTAYKYPPGYLLTNPDGVEGPTPRAVSRLEHIRRFLDRHPTPQLKHEA